MKGFATTFHRLFKVLAVACTDFLKSRGKKGHFSTRFGSQEGTLAHVLAPQAGTLAHVLAPKMAL